MGTPYLSEIKITSFGFPPKGWALCNGQLLPINQNQALFSVLTTTYGGDGRVNFALPNMQGRVPTHRGTGMTLGERGGEQSHTVTISETPTHVHMFQATSQGADTDVATANLFGAVSNVYTPAANLTSLIPGSLANVGGSQPHNNMQPYLTLNFCIALQGVFPSQS